ncbi:MAG: arylsulfatase A [Arcticibacterium sp.]|jgi:arylsulfatase A
MEYIDKLVGKIIGQLEKSGLRENTMFIFYNGNGTPQSIISMKGNKTVKEAKSETIDNGN